MLVLMRMVLIQEEEMRTQFEREIEAAINKGYQIRYVLWCAARDKKIDDNNPNWEFIAWINHKMGEYKTERNITLRYIDPTSGEFDTWLLDKIYREKPDLHFCLDCRENVDIYVDDDSGENLCAVCSGSNLLTVSGINIFGGDIA